MIQQAKKLLKTIFGYDSFRGQQAEIIQHILLGKDAIVLMPTGGGKSICYQIPALLSEHTTLVISPLISLMKDQVDALRSNGIKAAYYNSTLVEEEKYLIQKQAAKGQIKLLYLSPETLLQASSTWLHSIQFSLVAIDEAHCVSMWGHDFRPEYTQIKLLRQQLRSIPFIALTATADKITRKDIEQHLGLEQPTTFLSSFNRPNLFLNVKGNVPKQKKIDQIIEFISHRKNQAGIIYCLSRKECEEWAQFLKEAELSAAHYHAGMPAQERDNIQSQFINDDIQIICATIAFGMGIDKSNVRWVIHNNLPKNMEGYYQEIGRAGRDGLPSQTLLYYNYRDVKLLSDFAQESEHSQVLLEKLNRMLEYAEATTCRRKILLAYFSEELSENCGKCDICLNPQETVDGTQLAQKALSAIKRTHEKVGIHTLIEILRGAKTADIFSNQYHLLKTFGAGADLPIIAWLYYINQFKNNGLIEVAYDDHMHFKITPLGLRVLFGEQQIQVSVFKKDEKGNKTKKSAPKAAVSLSQDELLFDRLKLLRRKIAVEDNLPAYVVFSDASLEQMAKERPTTANDFLSIQGVGSRKLEQYGEEFIALIKTFEAENQPKSSTYEETLSLVKQGLAVEQIAQIRNLNPTTIYSHLAKIYSEGFQLNLNHYIEQAEIDLVKNILPSLENTNQLKPIFEALNGELEYGKIRLALSVLESNIA